MTSTDSVYAQTLDEQDELAHFRERFVIDDPGLIYLDGNSLGRLPTLSIERLQNSIEHEWGKRLIRGWNEGWIEAPNRIGDKVGELLGARLGEVVLADATSVNLFKLALAAVRAQPGRLKIVTDNLNFPSDLYILQSICRLTGASLEVVNSADGIHGPVEGLAAAVDQTTALVALSHTVFKSGYTYDMAAVTEIAHQAGALALWDLSHSAGSVPVALNAAAADLAVGCTYKYLNGGPGAPAFLYVRHDLQEKLENPIAGWMGQRNQFDFGLDYDPAPGIQHFMTGTPAVLALAAVEPGIDLLLEAGMERVRAKSLRQTSYLIDLWETLLAPLGFRLNSPRDEARRGSHISLGHDEGMRINLALINELGVLPDFRRPDNIRLGIAPLYNTFCEIHTAVTRLQQVVTERLYEHYDPSGIRVT